VPYVLFVGTIEPRKNLVRLVRAYRRAAASGVPHGLVLAGPLGWHHESLMRELALEGPGEIVMTGALTPEELDAVYRAADAFVYPSLYEGFGLPALEAMACGTPVLASNVPALAELVDGAGVLVHPTDVEAIADGLRSLLGDEELRARLGAAGSQRAGRYGWDVTARRTAEVLRASAEAPVR
jgi:glycosyltransferase involved in cell wall biosynthesis